MKMGVSCVVKRRLKECNGTPTTRGHIHSHIHGNRIQIILCKVAATPRTVTLATGQTSLLHLFQPVLLSILSMNRGRSGKEFVVGVAQTCTAQ
jgi:hypothetical protein